jgi:ribosomal protein S18 acetylase RimI-like enzyme
MIIRPAITADARAIASIQVTCWRLAYAGILEQSYLQAMSVEEKEAFWAHAIGNTAFGEVAVALAGSEVVGFTSYGPSRIEGADREIYTLYVAPDQHRRGVGNALITKAERPGLVMEARTAEGNPFAAFYLGIGAVPVRRDTLQLGGKNYPLICYQWRGRQPVPMAKRR